MENDRNGVTLRRTVTFALCYAFVLQCLISWWASIDDTRKPAKYLSLVVTLSEMILRARNDESLHGRESKERVGSDRSPPPFHQDFVTPAVEREIAKHDRLLFQGMAYMSSLTSQTLQKKWMPTGNERPTLCINILTCNRRVPYIDAMMMSLMSGNSPEKLMGYVKINLLNLERRRGRMNFEHLRNTLSKIPFVDVYNISEMELKEETKGSEPITKTFRETLILDTIQGLKLCVDSGLPWCLLLEEDAIFSKNFVANVERYVIRPLEELPLKNETSVVSLYSYYNSYPNWSWNGRTFKVDAWGKKRVESTEYGNKYEKDRSKTKAEMAATNTKQDRDGFSIIEYDYPYGAVAQLYSIDSVYLLISYLKNEYPEAEKYSNDADLLISRKDKFSHFSRRIRRQVEPSMVNHIGFYSERMMNANRSSHSQMNTDARFNLNGN